MIQRSISELPADYVSLHVAQRMGATPVVGEVVLSSPEPLVPISLSFLTLADQIAYEATAFVEPVAELLNIAWDDGRPRRCRWGTAPRYRAGASLDRAAKLLSAVLPTLLALPEVAYLLWGDAGQLVAVDVDGATSALRLAALHRAARSVIGLTRHATRLPVPCQVCNEHTVVRYAGSHTAVCQSCGGRWSEREYQRWTLVLAYGRSTG